MYYYYVLLCITNLITIINLIITTTILKFNEYSEKTITASNFPFTCTEIRDKIAR